MARRVRDHDWAATPLGAIDTWPPELRTAAAFVLENHLPAALIWGPGLVTIYNDAFRPILGTKREALGRSFADVWREAWPEIGPIVERAFAGHATFIEDYPLVIDRSGEPEQAYFTFCYSPVRAADGTICGMIDVVIETTARIKARAELRTNEERSRLLAAIVESSDDAIITKNLDGIITSWNKGAERIFGYTAEEAIGRPITILIPADRQDEEPSILDRIRRGVRIEHYETVRQRKDGSRIDISLTVSPLKRLENEIVGASKIARDITDRSRAEKLVTTLAREAEHRTKNILATVLATVHLSNAETSAELKHVIEGRIRALADVHTLFVQSRWSGADIRTIIAQELAPYGGDGDGRAVLDGPSLSVRTEVAQALAVTLHELATNAAKYGALSTPAGSVRVTWSPMSDGPMSDGPMSGGPMPDERVLLRWIESDGPPVTPPTRKGFGTRVMQSMIAAQGGTTEFAWNPDGLVCEIVLPG